MQIRLGRNYTNSRIRAIATREEIDVLLDGALVSRLTIGGECIDSDEPHCTGTGTYRTSPYNLTADDSLVVRFPASAGMHSLGVAFVRKSVLTEGPGPNLLPPRHTSSTYTAPRMDIDYVRLEGPFETDRSGGHGEPAPHLRLPAGRRGDESRARSRYSKRSRGAPTAGRSPSPMSRRCSFYRSGHAEGGFERAFRKGWRGCWSRRSSCSASSATPRISRRTASTRSATWSSPRGCRSSCGAPSRTTSCWRSRPAARSGIRGC